MVQITKVKRIAPLERTRPHPFAHTQSLRVRKNCSPASLGLECFPFSPTACAVGCILLPLRGSGPSRFLENLGNFRTSLPRNKQQYTQAFRGRGRPRHI